MRLYCRVDICWQEPRQEQVIFTVQIAQFYRHCNCFYCPFSSSDWTGISVFVPQRHVHIQVSCNVGDLSTVVPYEQKRTGTLIITADGRITKIALC